MTPKAQTLTLGVIGHVDHGKTALVRALTGIETDRLKEERERGMSIVLGFSYLETPHSVIDLIDVPGHEDFIRAMISGATGLDGVILIIAANESVMPQTREHFDIARLLDVQSGIVVITKADLVSADTLEATIEDIGGFVHGTFLENAPYVATSAVTGEGIDELRRALTEVAAVPVERPAGRNFYLPLDRVFTMRGFGLVVTGTLRGGILRVNDRVQVMPSGRAATVRALQSRHRPIEEAYPGQRVAVNLRNIGYDDLRRGDALGTPGSLTATRRVDAELRLLEHKGALADAGLKNGATVRLLIGTTEAIARVRLLDEHSVAPGATALAQLYLDRDIATQKFERFVIRSYSPMATIGGGRILDANPKRHRRFDASVRQRLETAATGTSKELLQQLLAEAGARGIEIPAAAEAVAMPAEAVGALLSADVTVRINDRRIVARSSYAELMDRIAAEVARYHREHPHHRGIAAGQVKGRIAPEPHEDVFRRALTDLVAGGILRNDNETLCMPDFDPLGGLSDRERRAAAEIERKFLQSGLAPPPLDSVVGRDKTKLVVYRLLLETGRLVKLRTYDRSSELVLHAKTLEDIRRRLGDSYPYPEKFALKDVRDLLGSTRKYVVPLMEHFDATGITIRFGDLRQLREH